ncbi:lipopolysaccharide biosynthesis protein [Deinococcus humi]|nr:oligosaccharide flippase family protein [Deinococcus humi]GGO18970.1 teichoic acid transporter [Deinococcus humi]
MRAFFASFLGGSTLRRNIIRIVGGAASGQIIVLLTSPLIARLYTPADFGSLATYASLLSILLVAVNLRYDLAIIRPSNDDEALRVLAIALVCAVVFSLILLTIVPVLVPLISTLMPQILAWLLPLGLLLTGIYQALNYWAVRRSEGGVIGQTRLVQSSAMVGIQLLGGLSGGTALGLGLGYIAGQAAGVGRLFRLLPMRLWIVLTHPELLSTALKYRQFPLLSLPSGLANIAALQLPTLFVAHNYGLGVAGWLALAQRILGGPLDLLGAGVSQAFMSELSRDQSDTITIRKLFDSVARRLAVLSFPIILIGMACPTIFTLVFGPTWRESGIIAALLSMMYASRLLSNALSQTLIILDKLKWMFCLDLLRLSLVLAVFAIFNSYTYIVLICAYSVVMSISYIAYFMIARLALQHHIPMIVGKS